VHGAGLLAAITPADDLYCYHFDATGNTVAITDSSESVVNSYDYSPFGMILSESETFAQPFKFVGRLGVMAESNGFYYMRARYYDPVAGRFISEDPMGFDGGDVNLYVYVQNNPLLLVDPRGLASFLENYRNNVNITNSAIFGNHINTVIGLATSGQVARNMGTTTAAGLLITLAETGGLQTATLNAAGAVVSAATTMVVNGAVVALSLEAGIHVGSLINAGFQTIAQSFSEQSNSTKPVKP
jgi:RHS repeat-associated protein